MDALSYIAKKYFSPGFQLDGSKIEIPNVDRNTLAQWFGELGFRVGAEVGVEQGAYSKTLFEANPRARIYLIDAWEPYGDYREHVTQSKLDNFMEITKSRVEGFDARLIKAFSLDAAKQFDDNTLDFVYIDANHKFEYTVADIAAWYPKVRSGGIISGHDFVRRKNIDFGVIEAVSGYTSAYNIKPWFVLGRKDKIEGELRDNSRSWMWVKP